MATMNKHNFVRASDDDLLVIPCKIDLDEQEITIQIKK
jgi:hypothetical protein